MDAANLSTTHIVARAVIVRFFLGCLVWQSGSDLYRILLDLSLATLLTPSCLWNFVVANMGSIRSVFGPSRSETILLLVHLPDQPQYPCCSQVNTTGHKFAPYFQNLYMKKPMGRAPTRWHE